jgi:cyclic-di-GMP phosphodiesterase TipF (flagellum assembly factor)
MSVLNHIFVAVSYSLVAAAVAIGLPHLFPAVGVEAGAILGGVVLVGSALLHEVFARQEGEARTAEEIESLRIEHGTMRKALSQARAEVETLRSALNESSRSHEADEETARKNVDSVIAEVKVLQGLIEQLWTARAAPRMAADGKGATRPVPGSGKGDIAADQRPAPAAPLTLVVRDGRALDGGEAPGELPPVARGLSDEAILNIVREGLETNRVDLVLQPVVSLPQRKRCHYEAFTRIRDHQGRMLVPEQYIAIAEREGLITAIDNMMLFRCVQLRRRSQNRNQNVGFFCNISAHSLTDRHFFSNFVEFMADNAALAPNLIFEFPYATIANRDLDIERHLRQLASFGFRFSVDQVSGLNLDYGDLMRHRFKYIKMDAMTLLNELRQPTASFPAEEIKRVADRHGIDLIVEKIESEPMLLELLDLRIDYGQGYLFGEPRLAKVD